MSYANHWRSGYTIASIEEQCCGKRHPSRQPLYCTREKEHTGFHAGHGGHDPDSPVIAVWEDVDPDLQVDEGL